MNPVRDQLDAFDWGATDLGPRAAWPASLDTIFAMMLDSPFAMCATWGPAQTLLYNAAYAPFLKDRHPAALGQPIAAVWSDVWSDIGPLVERVLNGESVRFTELHLKMFRDGRDEDTWWTFAYSPLRDQGRIMGMLNVTTDVTAGVVAGRQRDAAEAELRQRNAILEHEVAARREVSAQFSTLVDHLSVGVCLLDADGKVLLSNPMYKHYLLDYPLLSSAPEAQDGGRWRAYDPAGRLLALSDYPGARALRGESVFPGVECTFRQDDGVDVWVTVSAVPLFDDAGKVATVLVVITDIDERKRASEQARLNAERVRLALAAGAIIGTWVWDVPTNRFTVDDAFATAFGFAPTLGREGISLEQVIDTVHPDDRAGLAEAIDEALRRGGRYAHQYRVRRHDGRYYWIEANGYVNHDADRKPLTFPGVLLDVEARRAVEAERDRAEAALRALNADLEREVLARTLARGRTWDLSSDFLAVFDLDGRFDKSNPAWRSGLGWTEGELAATEFMRLVHPDDRARTQAIFAQCLAENTPVLRFDNRYRHKDGRWRWLSWIAVPDGDRVYCSARDVTGDKERAVALLRYVDIVESDAAPIVAFDAGYRVIAFNRAHRDAFHRRFGHEAQLGEVLPDLMPPEGASRLIPLLDRALAGETFVVREEFGPLGAAHMRFDIHYAPLRDESGKVIGGFYRAKDVTAHEAAQAELADVHDTLRQAQKMEAVGQLTGGLAHDFNNLLAGIMGSLELIDIRLKSGRPGDVQRYLAVAKQNVNRAAALTHRLLAFSRRQTLAPQVLDPNTIVGGMAELVGRTAGPAIAIDIDLAHDRWFVLADPSQLENALLNLCINARDAMPDGGRITISTANATLDDKAARALDTPPGDYLTLRVGDTGSGMPEHVVAKAFEPFFTTKPLGEGTGLGLSMIYGFAKQSGGQAHIVSTVGVGSTVCLYLPRFLGDADVTAPTEPVDVDARQRGKTIVVVDDEPAIRMLIEDALSEYGHTVLLACDGKGALETLMSSVHVDLMVTDVGLPGGMNGRELADAVRSRRPGLPILFITGYAESRLFEQGQCEAHTAILTKPFTLQDLSDKVEALMTAGRSDRADTERTG